MILLKDVVEVATAPHPYAYADEFRCVRIRGETVWGCRVGT
jgi:hypothetical protein